MTKVFHSLVLPIVMICMAVGGYCQDGGNGKPRRPKTNTIEFNFILHEFFDGNPIVQVKYKSLPWWHNLALGLTYTRSIGPKHGFELAYRRLGNIYYDAYLNPKPPGWVARRSASVFDLLYTYKFHTLKQMELLGLVGLNFRYGDEAEIMTYGSFDVHTENYLLRDPGLTAGLRANQPLFWNIQLSAELKYTFYVYRYSKVRPGLEAFSDGPSRHMLTMQLGLGYRF